MDIPLGGRIIPKKLHQFNNARLSITRSQSLVMLLVDWLAGWLKVVRDPKVGFN
jgi:hypothetical protein